MHIKAGLFTALGAPVSGVLDLTIRVQRDTDHWFLDFNDGNFKAAGHVAIDATMTEPDVVREPGWYMYDLLETAFTAWTKSTYTVYINNSGVAAPPAWHDIVEFTLPETQSNVMEVYKGYVYVDRYYPVRLVDSVNLNTPILGVVFGNVRVGFISEGLTPENVITPLVGDWVEIGAGNYWLRMGALEWNGFFTHKVRVYPAVAGAFADHNFVVEIENDKTITSLWCVAQAGGNNFIKLDAGESPTNYIHDHDLIVITGGLGAGQTREIVKYIGNLGGVTVTAYVDRDWQINPNNTSRYVIIPHKSDNIQHAGKAQAGAAGNIQLVATASALNDFYNGCVVEIVSGIGAGQSRIITDYDGGTTVAYVYPNWITNPNATSVYKVYSIGQSYIDGVEPVLLATLLAAMGSAVLDADLQLHLGAGVGFRNIGNILGQEAQVEFQQRTNIFAAGAVVAQGITAAMAARGCIQYIQVDMSYTKNWAAPDRTFYLLFHYNAQMRQDIVKASLLPVW